MGFLSKGVAGNMRAEEERKVVNPEVEKPVNKEMDRDYVNPNIDYAMMEALKDHLKEQETKTEN